MFQMGRIGPVLGQTHHFRSYAPEKTDYTFNRQTNEANRLYRIVDKRLAKAEYLAGDYSVAEMATYPWLREHEIDFFSISCAKKVGCQSGSDATIFSTTMPSLELPWIGGPSSSPSSRISSIACIIPESRT